MDKPPETIYLIPGEDLDGQMGYLWCDDPAPTDDHDPTEAVKYVRAYLPVKCARKEFELWISSPPFEKSVERYPDDHTSAWPGQYRDIDVALAWEACRQGFGRELRELTS